MWGRPCGVGDVRWPMWVGGRCGVANVGRRCAVADVGRQCGVADVGSPRWGGQSEEEEEM